MQLPNEDALISYLASGPRRHAPRVIWRTRVEGLFHESISAIHGNRAFILCSDGFLHAFE